MTQTPEIIAADIRATHAAAIQRTQEAIATTRRAIDRLEQAAEWLLDTDADHADPADIDDNTKSTTNAADAANALARIANAAHTDAEYASREAARRRAKHEPSMTETALDDAIHQAEQTIKTLAAARDSYARARAAGTDPDMTNASGAIIATIEQANARLEETALTANAAAQIIEP